MVNDREPPPQQFSTETNSILGVRDGTNNRFALTVPCKRLVLWRNGILQTANADYVFSGAALLFLPGSTPQPGDILTGAGYVG